MIYDYKNRKISFESPGEKADYDNHMAQFGPGVGIEHPDDCEYCARKGWKNFVGTTWDEECDKWAAEHPDEA